MNLSLDLSGAKAPEPTSLTAGCGADHKRGPSVEGVVAAGPTSISPEGEWVLLVEDEEMVRKMAARALRVYGYRVLEAMDGYSAIELWGKHAAEIGLLFSDMVMPKGPNGIELAKRFTVERPDLKVIIASGYSVDLAKSGLPDPTAAVYLAKPYEIVSLINLVRRLLKSGIHPVTPTNRS